MNLMVNDIIEMDNYSYKVLDIVNYKDNMYLFLINNDDFINDTAIVKALKSEKNIELMHIDDDKEFEYVLKKIYLDNKKAILSYFD